MEIIVVTRHIALLQYLINNEYVKPDVKHISHAKIEDINDKHVFGIMPNWLSCHAGKLTELQLRLPIDKRNVELTLEEIEFFLVEPKTYIIREVEK